MAKPPTPDEPEGKSRTTRKRPARASEDLLSFAKAARFQGIVQSPESLRERESRLRIEAADAEHARAQEVRKSQFEEWRDRLILKSGRAILSVVGVYCLTLNALPGQTTERRAWATSTLTGIVGGLVGYIVGTAKK